MNFLSVRSATKHQHRTQIQMMYSYRVSGMHNGGYAADDCQVLPPKRIRWFRWVVSLLALAVDDLWCIRAQGLQERQQTEGSDRNVTHTQESLHSERIALWIPRTCVTISLFGECAVNHLHAMRVAVSTSSTLCCQGTA